MVGTRPIRRPEARALRETSLIPWIRRTISMELAVRLRVRWERASPHLLGPAADRLHLVLVHVRVAPDELRHGPGEHPEEVVDHEDLAVATRAGADADRRDRDLAGDAGREG